MQNLTGPLTALIARRVCVCVCVCVCVLLFCLVLTLSKREDFPVVYINNFREKERLRQDFPPGIKVQASGLTGS